MEIIGHLPTPTQIDKGKPIARSGRKAMGLIH